jgi:hypothetical protein
MPCWGAQRAAALQAKEEKTTAFCPDSKASACVMIAIAIALAKRTRRRRGEQLFLPAFYSDSCRLPPVIAIAIAFPLFV